MSRHALIPENKNLLDRPTGNNDGALFGRDSGGDSDDYFRPTALNNRLTVSFAPDGTTLFSHQSSFYQSFQHLLDASQLEQTILGAFKTWARHGNLDAGLVADSGDAFGVSGRTYGDQRFGDVRIGAFPMASDVYAIALGQGDFVSGTWAGDILFNSNANFESTDHFFAVALHEIGHSLGLDHSTDPTSVMHRQSTRLDLSANDVTNFQQLYGLRSLDPHDDDEGNNDSVDSATKIKFDDDFGPKGSFPSVAFGDISSASDIDYFKVEIPNDYIGPVTFQLVSEGISLLASQVSVLSEDGATIETASSNNWGGDLLALSISQQDLDDKMYIRIVGASATESGSYSLITTLDDRVVVDNQMTLAVARNPEFVFLDQDDIAEYLADPQAYLFNDDDHSDDHHHNAHELFTEDGFEGLTRFRYAASLLDQDDVDVYAIKTIPFDSTNDVLNIALRSVEVGGMIPTASVFDSEGNRTPGNTIVNGMGEYVVQIEGFELDKEYFVHVSANDFLPFQSGSYELTISYSDAPVQFQNLAGGSIGNTSVALTGSQNSYHSLHVAESQMFQFALDAESRQLRQDVIVWATIYDQGGAMVHQEATRVGERNTGSSVYFRPGSYTVEIELRTLDGQPVQASNEIQYQLSGINVGDGQGPDFNDPTDSPFVKNGNGEYEYPDDVLTASTFVLVDGISSNQDDPPVDDPPNDLYGWYWGL